MRSCLVVSVLALLVRNYVHSAPQHIGRLLKNSTLDNSELEIPLFESERAQGTEITNTEDKTEFPTTKEKNAEINSGGYIPVLNYYDHKNASSTSPPQNSEKSGTSTTAGSDTWSLSLLRSNTGDDPRTASEEITSKQREESFSTTSLSTEPLSSDNKMKRTDAPSELHITDDIEGNDDQKTSLKENIDSTTFSHYSEFTPAVVTLNSKTTATRDDYDDEELTSSTELMKARERDEEDHSSPAPNSTLTEDKFSINEDVSDGSPLNSELEVDKNTMEIALNKSTVNISEAKKDDERRTSLDVTTTTLQSGIESLKLEHKLEGITTTSVGTEETRPQEETTSMVTNRNKFGGENEKVTSDIVFSSSTGIVGLNMNADILMVTTTGLTTFDSESKDGRTSSFPHTPSVSGNFEENISNFSSAPPSTFIDEVLTDKQVLSSDVSKTSDDIILIPTIMADDHSPFTNYADSELEGNIAVSQSPSSSGISSSGSVANNADVSPVSSVEPTSELFPTDNDQTVTLNSGELVFSEDEQIPAKSTSDADSVTDDDNYSSTTGDTLSHSNLELDFQDTTTKFPATDTASSIPTLETTLDNDRSLELKSVDIKLDTSEIIDTSTPLNERTTAAGFSTTSPKETTSVAKEKTTTLLIWQGPTILPRQTTTSSSEMSTELEETEFPAPKGDDGELKTGDSKDLFSNRFSDRYLSGNNTDMVAAVQFLHYHDKASSEQCFKLVDAHWNYATNLTEENKRKQLDQTLEYSLFHKEAWKSATSFAWKSFNDTLLRRWFKSLSILGNAALPEDRLTEFNRLKADMKNTYSTAKVCPYVKPEDRSLSVAEGTKCNLSLEPDLQSILVKSRDYDELVHVWKAWRDAAGKPIRQKFLRFVNFSNEAATLNGFPDTGDMWREAYESDSFQQDLDLLWEQLRPLYEHLHAYVRRKLINQYGFDKIREDGPIPAHLFGNMWAQSWVSLLDITQPFPGKPSVDVTSTMEAKNMTSLDMFKVSEEFFTSLGLKPMPEEFWKHSLIEKPEDREIICHASAWDFCNGKDYRIKQCTDITMEDLVTVHHEMGHIQYFLQYARQPNVFREGANPGFHEAIGDVLALSVSTPKHLLSIGLLDEIADDPEGDLNFLLRTALEKVSFLPSGYLIDLWRWGLFSGEIKYEEMNAKWWELRLKYQGVCPPVKRTEEDFDPGAKYHVAGNVPYIRYFVSFVIQFQFHKVLCDAAGHAGPLYKCDIYQSKEAGQILSQVMELGSSEHWSEAMRIMTGGAQTKMDAQPIMEYFEPLLNWLIEQNKNETLGWKSDDATVCP